MRRLPHLVVLLALAISALAQQPITIPTGVPLHIRTTHRANLHIGTPVAGVLTEPIYVHDRLILPIGSAIHGTVTAYAPIDRTTRAQALLNGDVTPLHVPIVTFNTLHLAATNQDIALSSTAEIRTTKLVRFVKKPRHNIFHQAVDGVDQRIHETWQSLFGPGIGDRSLRLLYSQLPYHPQRIWSGTQFIADLITPASVPLPTEPPPVSVDNADGSSPLLDGQTVSARLDSTLDSATAHKGDSLTATITAPLFDSDHRLLLPEGSQLEGLVSAAKPARSFGRNGALRFAIRGIKPPAATVVGTLTPIHANKVYGTLTGADGASAANLSVDSEGNVQANPPKDRFVAPLLLALTVGHGGDRDRDGNGLGRDTVASNGFGVVARIVALTANDRNVALGFGYYALAKSIYFRFLTRGHQVTFPKDTQVEVALSTR